MSRGARATAGGLVAGGLHALAVREPWAADLVWVSLVPLLVAVSRTSAAGTVVATVAYAVTAAELGVLDWLGPALETYFGLGAPTASALAVAIPALLGGIHGLVLGALLAAGPRLGTPATVVWYAALFASWEALRTLVPPFCPVLLLAASRVHAPATLQLASVTGVAGVTASVVAVNAGIAALVAPGGPRRRRAAALLTGLVLGIGPALWGTLRLRDAGPVPAGGPIVTTVDANAHGPSESTLARWIELTPADRVPPPALVVWPESALPLDLERHPAAWRRLGRFVERLDTVLVTGGEGATVQDDGTVRSFNAVHVLRPRHGMQSYHKRWLVPLAETWPPFLGPPPATLEPVAAGREVMVFDAGGVSFGPLVCFEIADAAGARTLARLGAQVILNPTNDAWFPPCRAPHVSWAVMRAVETGRPVVRAANAGPSLIVDPFGRRVTGAGAGRAPAVMSGPIPRAVDTVYLATGERFLPVCLLVVLAGIVRRRSARGGTEASKGILPHAA